MLYIIHSFYRTLCTLLKHIRIHICPHMVRWCCAFIVHISAPVLLHRGERWLCVCYFCICFCVDQAVRCTFCRPVGFALENIEAKTSPGVHNVFLLRCQLFCVIYVGNLVWTESRWSPMDALVTRVYGWDII